MNRVTSNQMKLPTPEQPVSLLPVIAEPKTYGEGKSKLACRFLIRDDVEQPFKGSSVFDDMFLDKDTVNWDGWFDHRKIHAILLTQPKPKLEHTSEGVIQYINGLDMKVKVDKAYDDFRGKTVNKIHYMSYKPTDHPRKAAAAEPKKEEAKTEIPDSELPF